MVAPMSRWVCTTPLGRPVEPELYSQNAMSSGWVSAGGDSSSGRPATASSKLMCPAASPLATSTRSCGRSATTGSSFSSSAASTTRTVA